MAHSALVSGRFRKRSITSSSSSNIIGHEPFKKSIQPSLRNTAHISTRNTSGISCARSYRTLRDALADISQQALARSFATVAKARLDLMLILDRARHVTDKPNIGRQIGQADIFVPHLEQVEMAPRLTRNRRS